MTLIKHTNYAPIIRALFPLDKELFQKWHVLAGQGVTACVERTIQDLSILGDKLDFFLVVDGEEPVGFFGKNDRYLNTFFIVPSQRYRSGEIFNVIRKALPENCLTGLYKKNERAIRFLKENGAQLKEEFVYNGEQAVLLTLGKVS